MQTVGQIIKTKRETLGLLLRQVAAQLDIDQAILSKIERGERRPTRANIVKLAEILNLDTDDLLIQYISEKIAYEIAEEDFTKQVLSAAEKKIKYLKSIKNGKV